MAISVSQTPKTTKASIFYVNDIHGQTNNMERITTASKDFDAFVSSENPDKLKLASGDIFLGGDLKVNTAADKFLRVNKFMASALGNHELDLASKDLVNITNGSDCKVLGLNAEAARQSPLNNKLIKSYIQEENGSKYGIIGLAPFDLPTRIKNKENLKDLKIEDITSTISDLQKEVDALKEKGVDKIILLSHTGYANEVKIAQNVEGIDVILGGHSHDLIQDIKEGTNLFYSRKTGEPTIITQAGRDGNYFGILNLEFDNNGVITKAQNNVIKTNTYDKNMPLKYVYDTILGQAENVGFIRSAALPPSRILVEENPHANFLCDAIKNELNVDIGMVNAANLRGNFESGEVTTRDISAITPFRNKMTIITVNEKELVDAIKWGAKSMITSDNKPGLMQVSGLSYAVNKLGELVDLNYIDKDGNKNKIDINNPNVFKTYTVGIDDFCAKGRDGFSMLNKYDNQETIKFDFDKDKLAADYIKKFNAPIDIKTDGRIQIVD